MKRGQFRPPQGFSFFGSHHDVWRKAPFRPRGVFFLLKQLSTSNLKVGSLSKGTLETLWWDSLTEGCKNLKTLRSDIWNRKPLWPCGVFFQGSWALQTLRSDPCQRVPLRPCGGILYSKPPRICNLKVRRLEKSTLVTLWCIVFQSGWALQDLRWDPCQRVPLRPCRGILFLKSRRIWNLKVRHLEKSTLVTSWCFFFKAVEQFKP